MHFWWSDERFVPRGHADRNDAQAREALLDALDVPAGNIHTMAASDDGLDLDAAAAAYAAELARFASDDDPWPVFDICFLGVGPDGHIASLFPDRPEIHVTSEAVLGVRDSPKLPPERITLTRPVINSSVRVWMVIAGRGEGIRPRPGARGRELLERARRGREGAQAHRDLRRRGRGLRSAAGPHRSGLLTRTRKTRAPIP